MKSEEAIAILEEAISKIPSLRASHAFSPEHVEFIQSTGLEISRIFGPNSPIGDNFARIIYQHRGLLSQVLSI